MGEYAGRVALVTGGSRGIGRATALRLASKGADVALTYRSRRAEADSTAAEVRSLGRRCVALACDVGDEADVARTVGAVRADLGPIGLLAHCGAISTMFPHQELTYPRWQEMIQANLTGAYLVTFAVKDEMLAREYGRIVLLSSVAALAPRKLQIHYSAAKAGVIAMVRCCAEAFAPHVRVNGVAPGLIDTEMAYVLDEELRKTVVAATPLGRMGTAEEMAACIDFLISDDCGFLTGHTLVPSGGRVMVP